MLIEKSPVIMTASKTIVSRTVKCLKPNVSRVERGIFSNFAANPQMMSFLAQSDDVSEVLLRSLSKLSCLVKMLSAVLSGSLAVLFPEKRMICLQRFCPAVPNLGTAVSAVNARRLFGVGFVLAAPSQMS
jgi:hypothetical protein